MQDKAKNIIYTAITIALITLSAYITIPFGPVPFTLQTFAITLAMLLFKPKVSISAFLIYLLMGAIGIPVFSAMRGGFGVILGPTGGFLWGYAISIAICSFLQDRCVNKVGNRYAHLAFTTLNCVILTLIAYACGTIQYSIVANITILTALSTTVIPFIIPDLAKIVIAIVCSKFLRKEIN